MSDGDMVGGVNSAGARRDGVRRAATIRGIAVLTLVIAVSACGSRSGMNARDVAEDPARVASIDRMFSAFTNDGAPGASVAIARNGRLVFARGYGMADLEAHVPAGTLTNYRLASVTKAFTAMAILTLVRDGTLSLDDEVRSVLPEMPAYTAGVRVRHLLTHSSGMPTYEDLMLDGETEQVHDRDMFRLLARTDSMYFKPDTQYRYSNTGYSLLALIVERKSGMTFADFLAQRIFKPLDMSGTVAHTDGVSTVERRAYGYSERGGVWRRTDQSTTSAVLGDGGVYSSVTDLLKWDLALRTPAYARPDSPAFPDSAGHNYAFGWFHDRFNGHRREWHQGETRGFNNIFHRYPDDGLTIIILTNRNDSEPWKIADRIATLYLK
ncbi:MAG: serine hydrolase domain-containing protein [Longimicrobiales bacterium]